MQPTSVALLGLITSAGVSQPEAGTCAVHLDLQKFTAPQLFALTESNCSFVMCHYGRFEGRGSVNIIQHRVLCNIMQHRMFNVIECLVLFNIIQHRFVTAVGHLPF